MKAIITRSMTSRGEHIQLLGMGETEESARIEAYKAINHGHNEFDELYTGGELVTVSQPLARLYDAAGQWADEYNAAGQLTGSSCPDAYFTLAEALGRLKINNGELIY